MNRRPVRIALAATVAAGVAAAASFAAAWPAGAGGTGPSLAAARRATARYHDVAVAVADGYVPVGGCAADPALGGMGVHYLHPGRAGDPAIVATEPELLLYEPGPDGRLRLVGVEWFAVDADQDLATDAGRPSLFGTPFDGPMPGHEPGMPVHFDLHVWIWKHNPAGTFAAWNPNVGCTG